MRNEGSAHDVSGVYCKSSNGTWSLPTEAKLTICAPLYPIKLFSAESLMLCLVVSDVHVLLRASLFYS